MPTTKMSVGSQERRSTPKPDRIHRTCHSTAHTTPGRPTRGAGEHRTTERETTLVLRARQVGPSSDHHHTWGPAVCAAILPFAFPTDPSRPPAHTQHPRSPFSSPHQPSAHGHSMASPPARTRKASKRQRGHDSQEDRPCTAEAHGIHGQACRSHKGTPTPTHTRTHTHMRSTHTRARAYAHARKTP